MKSLQSASNVGADVAKDEIVVACAERSFTPRKIANNRAALLAWLKTLPAHSRIGMEATSTYHELLAQLARKLGLEVYVLNPKDVRHYAKGVGQRAICYTTPQWQPHALKHGGHSTNELWARDCRA